LSESASDVLHGCVEIVLVDGAKLRGAIMRELTKGGAIASGKFMSICAWKLSHLCSTVRQVLQDFQENPTAAQKHLKQPQIMEKLQKLINAGIVRMA